MTLIPFLQIVFWFSGFLLVGMSLLVLTSLVAKYDRRPTWDSTPGD